MSENESLNTENDTFEGGEPREITNATTTLATTTLLNSQQVDSRTFCYSRVISGNGECVEPCVAIFRKHIIKRIICFIKDFLFNLI